MITNLKTPTKSTRQKRQDARKKRALKNLVRSFDAYVYQIENSDDPKIKRMVELGKKHMPLTKIIEIVDKEFPEE
jgi:hypothetical protein